ncbi:MULTISPECIES: hypothetical protein [unclassified Novosphingobium]|uniref:hypothetical protein n=1 Tax=unclassified Novosphingobium TaxID=2644732 RepID=UPI00135AC083|nr:MULTISPECIES: hypothetical protein [unclassified Novosphingobium]
MGEYAEMMLDGTLCECCGSFIDMDGGDGMPRYCSNQCARDRGAHHALPNPTGGKLNPGKTNCPQCSRRVKITGLADHIRDAHPHGVDPVQECLREAYGAAAPEFVSAFKAALRKRDMTILHAGEVIVP